MERMDKEMFTHVGKNLEAAQKIKRPSMSYLQDALRRLIKNKPAIFSFWILVIMIIMSIVGPVISKKVNGHTYRSQELVEQNQTWIMSNKRSITLKKNDVIAYDKYSANLRKTKISFKGKSFKGTGLIELRVGNEDEESIQGDKKEYIISVEVGSEDNWGSIVEKINEQAKAYLDEDPDFRGFVAEVKGDSLVLYTEGDSWFNSNHWFGTDEFGRDLFTRLWTGGRFSFFIAFIAVFVTTVFGIAYGGIAGYIGGSLDVIMMRIIEVLMVVPDMLYIILLLTVMRPGIKPIIIALVITGWMGTARIVRGEVMRLKHSEYVIAAQTLGADSKRIIFKHLIPNTMGPIIVNVTMMIPRMIFAEAFLSFIGLGVPVPYASWGSLINDGAKIFMQYPHQLLVPAVTLSLTMLAFNILGDGLRDALDPRLRK